MIYMKHIARVRDEFKINHQKTDLNRFDPQRLRIMLQLVRCKYTSEFIDKILLD
jgi:hypothetical protein